MVVGNPETPGSFDLVGHWRIPVAVGSKLLRVHINGISHG